MMVPFIIVSMMLVVQFGLAYYGRQVLAGAAQDGAATAALDGSSTGKGIEVANQLIANGGGGWIVNPTVTGARTGDVIEIRASGTAIQLVPFIPPIRITANGSATVEEFAPQGSG